MCGCRIREGWQQALNDLLDNGALSRTGQLTWVCVETRLYRRSESCFALTSSALLATAQALNRRQFGPIRPSFP